MGYVGLEGWGVGGGGALGCGGVGMCVCTSRGAQGWHWPEGGVGGALMVVQGRVMMKGWWEFRDGVRCKKVRAKVK